MPVVNQRRTEHVISHRRAAVGTVVVAMLGFGAAAQGADTPALSSEPATATEAKPSDAQNSDLSDETRIATAVESEIHHDVMLSSDNVGVRVERGTATLNGRVRSLMAKERAADVARTVKGVAAVVNKLEVRPGLHRTASGLESAVTQALVVSPATESFQVQVQADGNGTVRLSGNVDSWAERELAQRVASAVSGVTRVDNDVQVRFTGTRTDTEIAAEVQRMLQWDAYIDDSRIAVGVRSGVVKLSGSVASAAERNRAMKVAWTAGTKSVDASALHVVAAGADRKGKAVAQLSDADIEQAVKARLGLSPYTPEPELQVQVNKRVVTLGGTVANLKAKRVANLLASQTDGVLLVRNRLGVRSGDASLPSDKELEKQIRGALAVNSTTESYEIAVDASRGDVTLSGDVDSWFEKGMADDVAASVPGVHTVRNELRVKNSSARLAFDPYVDTWSIHDYDWYRPAQAALLEDSVLKRQIEREMLWSPFVDANQIHVSVDDAVATLTGSVNSLAEFKAAEQNALEGGAARIANRLTIQK